MTRMRILTPHLALTYPNHCPTSCRTNSHFDKEMYVAQKLDMQALFNTETVFHLIPRFLPLGNHSHNRHIIDRQCKRFDQFNKEDVYRKSVIRERWEWPGNVNEASRPHLSNQETALKLSPGYGSVIGRIPVIYIWSWALRVGTETVKQKLNETGGTGNHTQNIDSDLLTVLHAVLDSTVASSMKRHKG